MDRATFAELQTALSAIRTAEDVERFRQRLHGLALADPGDPDIPDVGEEFAMVALVLGLRRPGSGPSPSGSASGRRG
jgi:hypothetical protein